MTLSFIQKFLVYTTIAGIKALYLIDILTGKIFEKFAVISTKTMTAIIALGFLFFLGFALKTQYLANLAVSYVNTVDVGSISNKNVLGLATVIDTGPQLTRELDFPVTTAKAILVVDTETDKILYDRNSKSRLASASTTKLMAALVALDIYDLSDVVGISLVCSETDSAKAYLPEKSEYRVESLLNAMLVASAGDAACALAQGKLSETEFIYRMNQKAYQLNMSSSYFTNPIGLDGENSSHFSSASDLYKLTKAAMSNKTIRQIVAKPDYTIKSVDESYIGVLPTTNQLLLEIPQTIGVKTGTTEEAGQVLIYEYNDEQKDLVIVVMGSEDRFSDVRAILNWVLVSYEW